MAFMAWQPRQLAKLRASSFPARTRIRQQLQFENLGKLWEVLCAISLKNLMYTELLVNFFSKGNVPDLDEAYWLVQMGNESIWRVSLSNLWNKRLSQTSL